MPGPTNSIRLSVVALAAGVALAAASCGPQVVPNLPNTESGLSLSDLDELQSDERLTDDQRRDLIRQAIGAPNNDAGDRLVEFLLNANVP